jgi:hypothetical protein
MKSDDAPPAKPAAPPAPAVDKPPEPKPHAELAVVARENRKILEAKEQLKKERAEMAADLELVKKIRAGEFEALEAVDPKWYDLATRRQIAKAKPGAPEVVAAALKDEIAGLKKELEALKSPPPPPAMKPEAVEAAIATFRTEVATKVKANAALVELQKEDLGEVQEEVITYVSRAQAAAGRTFTDAEVLKLTDEALTKLEAAVRAQKSLTTKDGAGTTGSATGLPSGEDGAAGSQRSETRQAPKTMTSALHDAVPVSAEPKTDEERRQVAIELLRRAREAEAKESA